MPRPRKTVPSATSADTLGVYATVKDGRVERFRIRYDRPEVASYVARVLISTNMDYEAAVSKMFNAEAKEHDAEPPTDEQIISQARVLEKAPQIQTALQAQLAKIGIDDAAQERLIAGLWHAFHDKRNDKRWAPAVAALIKVMGLEKKASDGSAPVSLQVQGLEEGLDKMFEGKVPTGDTPAELPVSLDDAEEE